MNARLLACTVALICVSEPGPHLRAEPPASAAADDAVSVSFQTIALPGDPAGTVDLAWRPGGLGKRPAIIMMGAIKTGELPAWSTGLVDEGYLLAAFRFDYPPDPDPARRPQWLVFDERFAHGYVLGGQRAPKDAARVIDYLVSRGDVDKNKIGWLGSSSTGIPGLAAATGEKRLAAAVAFVSTGAYRQWLDTWHTNKLWRGKTDHLWPETEELLKQHDSILHVDKLFPTAILMVSGGEDKVVDPKTARAFVEAGRPYYERDPERLRLVVYEGFGHNLPADVVKLYAEHWFRLYMHPTRSPPLPLAEAASLQESARRTQINTTDHKDVVGAK
jgi:dienelactone hydrolase